MASSPNGSGAFSFGQFLPQITDILPTVIFRLTLQAIDDAGHQLYFI
jgi:hypothetical protein